MIGLDRLLDRRGVLAAGQFSPEGKMVRAVGSLSHEKMEQVAEVCGVHQRNAQDAAGKLGRITSLDWGHLNGWVIWAGKLALCVSGDTGVVVEAAKADFNQLMVDLFGPPAGEHPGQWWTPREGERAQAATAPSPDERIAITTDTHKPARPMRFIRDKQGNGWLCDKDVDMDGDLEAQGCWRCEDMAFPMGG